LKLHPNYLWQLFIQQDAETLSAFLLRVRLGRARDLLQMLQTPGLNVIEAVRL